MSVPTTLQGTHDGCGGTVVFRPAAHRSELLAGQTVVLNAACQACGETLSAEWRLPDAAIQAWEARQQAHDAHEQALPLAAGAEQWRSVAPAPTHQSRDDLHDRPVADLGDWRLREGTREAFSSAAPAPVEDSQPEPAPIDEAMQAYLQRFSSKVEHARESLRQASTDLPSAFESGDGSFRSPDFSRRPSLDESTLSSTPAALNTPIAPAATAPAPAPAPAPAQVAEPVFEPVAEPILEPAAEPVVEQPAPMPAAADIAAAVASPTFHDDVASEPEPVVAPAPIVSIAPTDADVFPPAQLAAPEPDLAPVQPFVPAVVQGPDIAASVWHEMPVSPAAPASVQELAATPPAPPVAPSVPSFAEAFGDAEAAMPALGQSISPVAAGAPIATAVAQPPAEDLSVVAPDDRGFDWGPDADSPALPKPARRRRGLRRGAAKAEAGAQPSIDAGPEVVFEPSLDADLSATPRRSTVGPVALVAVVLLAIVAGIAGMKVLTTDTESLQQSPAATPDVPPAIGAKDPAAGAGTGTSGTGTTPAKPGAKAKAKAKAKPTAPAAPPTAPGAAAPGTAVADPAPAEANPLADAAQDAGTSAPTAASQSQTTQVPGGDADMPVVTASDATSETNPFARPQ